MKLHYLFIWLFILPLQLVGQNQQKIDSLFVELAQKPLDYKRTFELYQQISFAHPDVVEGLEYAQKALMLVSAEKDLKRMAVAYDQISSQQRLLGNKIQAFDAAFDALALHERLGNQVGQADVNLQLGANYIVDKNYEAAKRYLAKSLSIYQVLEDSVYRALAGINLGEAYRLNHQEDSAVLHLRQVLLLNQDLQDEQIEGYALGNLGMIAVTKQEYTKAIEQLTTAISLLTALGDVYSVAVYQAEMGQVYLKRTEYQKGEEYLMAAFDLAKQEQLKEQVRDISEMLTNFYTTQQEFEKALSYQQVFQLYQDSLVNKENVQQLEQLKANYQIEKRETAIGTLESINKRQQQEAIALIIGISVLVLFALVLVWNIQQRRKAYRKLAEKKALVEQREQEKALLLRELNHRVKNNLQMISSLLNLQSNQLTDHPAMAAITAGKLRVEAMSLIHQKLYQEDHHTQIPMKDYVEELVRNLQFAYSEKTTLHFQLEDLQIDIDIAIPIALIINELVVNAFKYAYEVTEQPELWVSLKQEAEKLQLIIRDNGVGMTEWMQGEATSFGLTLVHSLVEQLDGKIYMTNEKGSAWHMIVKTNSNERL